MATRKGTGRIERGAERVLARRSLMSVVALAISSAIPNASAITLAIALSAACTAPDPEPPTKETRLVDGRFEGEVEASCAGCGFGLARSGCELAVRIDGRVLDVVGTGIDDHGDAHAPDGFCNAVRRARVSGRVEGERFLADVFELLPSGAR